MEQAERQQAKARLVANMVAGQSWREAAASAGLAISRSAAYRLTQRVRTEGEGALVDQRHGHPSKLSAPVQQWLVSTCRDTPGQSGRMLQAALEARFGLTVSIGHLNAMRAQLGIPRRRQGAREPSSDDAASH
jgi:transposase